MALGKRKACCGINIDAYRLPLSIKFITMKKMILGLLLLASIATTKAQETYAIKYDFFTPVAGCFGFSLEKARTNFTSLDFDAGLIGLKLGDYYLWDKFVGGYAAFGPRLYFVKDPAELHNFKGAYFKPQALANYFTYQGEQIYYNGIDYYGVVGNVEGTDFSLSLLLCLGNQWVLSDLVVFDLWFGLGYGGSWTTETTDIPEELYYPNYSNYKYSHVHFGDSPLIFDGGLSIGVKF